MALGLLYWRDWRKGVGLEPPRIIPEDVSQQIYLQCYAVKATSSDRLRGRISTTRPHASNMKQTTETREMGRPGRTVRKIRLNKNAVFWDVTPCGSCKNRRFGGT
jgi:hypothetical protein